MPTISINADLRSASVFVLCEDRTEKFNHPDGVEFEVRTSGELIVYAGTKTKRTIVAVFSTGSWQMVKYAD